MAQAIKLRPTHETGETGCCDLRYNIQMARAGDGVWYQRHIWHLDQLGEHNPPRVEAWIVSCGGPSSHMRQIA
jgi:hypothetical protein